MAGNRGFELTLEEGISLSGDLLLCFWEAGEDNEWLFSYRFTGTQLVWHGNVYAPEHVISKLPKVLDSETELREMIRLLGCLVSPKYRAALAERGSAKLSDVTNGSYEQTTRMTQRNSLMLGTSVFNPFTDRELRNEFRCYG